MKIYSVGQVNNYIKNIISQDYMLKTIAIKGEVSNCKYHSLGHIYFSLKDESGAIPAVMFKGNVPSGLDFRLQDGQAVVVSGSINVYEKDGKYQLYATKIKSDGAGRLFEEFQRLKQKLNEEGLFDFDKKKPVPQYPRAVGIVTASTGAAIQDIKNIAQRRNPYVQLILYPAKVQGENAADTIVAGIKKLDSMGLDTIIIGRGGGSIEDLWAFNEEKVVRAVYEASTPIISGVGHEIDITLSDYAADLRAPTPSAACELALPDVMTAVNKLAGLKREINTRMNQKLAVYRLQADACVSRLAFNNPSGKLEKQIRNLSELYDRLQLAISRKYDSYENKFKLLTARLEGLSPMGKLVNGFGYIESRGMPVGTIKDITENDDIRITLWDGIIDARVNRVDGR